MKAEPKMWEHPKDFPVEWHEQIASTVKRKMRNAITGAVSHKWVVVHSKPNHLRDCENMQVLAALLSKLLTARPEARARTIDSAQAPAAE
jgi:hypothetical protein